MKIIIFGNGFVGNTVADHLEKNTKNKIVRIDPKYFDTKFSDHKDADGAILCLPTPTIDGKCNDNCIVSVLKEIGNDIPVLLKSTVTPDLLEAYPSNVTYNPEFLRANTAFEDFDNQRHFILGGTETQYLFWKNIFSYMNVEFIKTDRATSSMVKYVHNNWLATKVAFFHELYHNLKDKYNHKEMIDILSKFENIGPSHMIAKNDQGNLGFGGYCFPKDTEAFYNYSNSDIIKSVIETNKKLNKL
jgi:UDP-glucose 6-dehydrogenase